MNVESYLKRNATNILTGMSVIGVICTAVSTVKATPKALELRDNDENVLSAYIPSILLGLTTISCILSAQVLNKRKQAMLTSAYLYLDTAFKRYKEKTIELYGCDADDKIETAIATDFYNEQKTSSDEKRLFYDRYSCRYFEMSFMEFEMIKNQLNWDYAIKGKLSLNDLYSKLNLEPTDYGEVIGWNSYLEYEINGFAWINLGYHKMDMPDNLECYALEYYTDPTEDFYAY